MQTVETIIHEVVVYSPVGLDIMADAMRQCGVRNDYDDENGRLTIQLDDGDTVQFVLDEELA